MSRIDGVESPKNLKHIMRVPLEVEIELGRTERTIKEISELGVGKIITLNSNVGDPVDLLINGQYFAQGEVVAIRDESHGVQDETYGIKIVSIISERQRLDKLSEMIR